MNKQRGFTLVELIMVIVMIGILAAVVGPRFFDRKVFDERLFFEQTLSAVRYAQKLAVASGCPVRAVLDGSGYALSYGAACGGAAVPDPSGGNHAAGLPSQVAVQTPLDITFNALGCVAANPAVPAACASGTRVATLGGFTLTVHAATGYIEAMP